ncbi:hypothetical protein QBC37DRAFT_298911 [Rhypophila decipiens]|uniref:NmrA-like domain-containing protein n=1 Tax=Rhypophila decipiens TaxID=261697 RepID=A0AAN6XXF3_9PEZI|nr:hypothetical protein QBC37DRAFT_298911 [Rhypophila decipiens]
MSKHHQTVFVTSATGITGSALCRILVAPPFNYTVRSTTRDRSTPIAQSLTALGVQFIGDGTISWSSAHEETLLEATKPCTKLFLCLLPNLSDLSEAPRQASLMIRLAKQAGITQVVGMTSLGVFMLETPTTDQSRFPPSGLFKAHLQAQSKIEDIITTGGFESWTILRPGFLMANFLEPKLSSLHGGLREIRDDKTWTTCLEPHSKLGLTDHVDIARLAASAFFAPGKFHGRELAVVSDVLTVQEVLDVLGEKIGLGPGGLEPVYIADECASGKETGQGRESSSAVKGGGFFAKERCLRNMLHGVDLEAKSTIAGPLVSFGGFLEREEQVVNETYTHF